MKNETNRRNFAILSAIKEKGDPNCAITPVGLDALVNLGLIEIADQAEIDRQKIIISNIDAHKEILEKLKRTKEKSNSRISDQVNILPLAETICIAKKEIELSEKIRDGLAQYMELGPGKFVRLTKMGREFLASGLVAA
ncbi:MAG: hypothetical protein PHT44_03545 [Candidatus Portnoybacteria bacterium]|nr:hypothetical protein [Candidatus Portnoybacteria bacterium]MDD4983098.1 hypothetical protein [Candidatus Portnoybacteria bacterium]